MAHNLATTNGNAAMAFRNDLPWHGLGKNMKDNPKATDAEWLDLSGTGFQVGLVPIYDANGNQIVPNRRLMARMDTGHVFDSNLLLTDHYKPIQNAEALEFARVLTKHDKHVNIETIGALGEGETFWSLLDLGKFDVKGDEMKKYLLLTNNHNGKQSFRGLLTSVRVVCQNTLNVALGDRESGFAIRHKGNIADYIKEAQRVLGFAVDEYDKLAEQATKMAEKKIKAADVDKFLNILTPNPEPKADGTMPGTADAENERAKIKELFEKGEGNDRAEIKGTVWALLNGVTDYIGHHKNMKSVKALTEEKRQARFNYVIMGSGAAKVQQAFNLGMQYVEKGKFEAPKPAEKKPRMAKMGGVLLN